MKQARGDEIQLVSVYIFFVSKQPTINSSKILIMNCDRAEKAEKASHPGNLPTSLLLISRMKKSWRKKRVFLEFFSLFCFSFWFLNLIHSYNMGILQKKLVQNVHSCLKQMLKHFGTPYMESPPPAVFHDKYQKRSREICYIQMLHRTRITVEQNQLGKFQLQFQRNIGFLL